MKRLDTTQIKHELLQLPGWRYDAANEAIDREYKFAGFADAFGFMTQIALAAEKRDHHPEWSNVYNRVAVKWTTHDAGGLTVKDIELAHLCNKVFAQFASGG